MRKLGLSSLEKMRLGGNLITLYTSLKEIWSEVGLGVTSQRTSGKTRGNSLKLYHGKFKLDIRNNFFLKRIFKYCNSLSKAVMESGFYSQIDVVLRGMV